MKDHNEHRRRPRRSRRAPRRWSVLLLLPALVVVVPTRVLGAIARQPVAPAGCPWMTAAPTTAAQDDQLAAEVDAAMTLPEKLGVINLSPSGPYENTNTGVPSLCIPPLRLQDGPDGLAYLDTGVTQLPASLATGATFDPSLAKQYGQVLGHQARAQGIGVVQAPNLDLVRVPEAGRSFEEFGEDPTLAGTLGAAEIEGIQSQGVEAAAKHFAGYTQETDRLLLDQQISVRTLEEVDFAPFRDAVEDAHVAAVMCAYGEINGVNACEDPFLMSTLDSWGFTGFVRSDLGAVEDPVAALEAGVDVLKPDQTNLLTQAVLDGSMPIGIVDQSVEAVLSQMFRFGLIQHPLGGRPRHNVASAHATHVALRDAEESVVLLKNAHGLLPLVRAAHDRIAVIGTDAAGGADVVGGGSSAVKAPFTSEPLAAIGQIFGKRRVRFASGDSPSLSTPLFSASDTAADPAPPGPVPVLDTGTLGIEAPENLVSPAVATATGPESGAGWASVSTSFTPAESGTYELTETGVGDTFLGLGGAQVLADPGIHVAATVTSSVELQGGVPVTFTLSWYRVPGFADPTVGITDETEAISAAANLAATSTVAVVFVAVPEQEQLDRSSLSLPGDEDALIDAVAAANPDTIVVLNSGGAVLMPWLSSVAAVLEAWYPGEEDGRAIAAVLSGAYDPSGHLPITFPASEAQLPTSVASDYPGVDGVVTVSEGLDIGYRWFDANQLDPLFPFGYGLSYTTFRLGQVRTKVAGENLDVSVPVANLGSRAGATVVQAYLEFPVSAGEPPHVLVGFDRIELPAGGLGTARVVIARSAFQSYQGGGFAISPGTYHLLVGTSSRDLGRPIALRVP